MIDQPIVFGDTIGLYRAANSDVCALDTAVLFISSWGFEELCARKLWRLLASELASRGIASLRFDYPGTGDALDIPDASEGLEIWHRSIQSAAKALKARSAARRLVLVGHGIGAALAWHAAETMDEVEALAMIAPALHGRQWVREFMALSKIADHGLIEHKVPPTGPTMGEQTIPDPILSDLRLLDCRSPATSCVTHVLALTRGGRPADEQFLRHLSTLGVAATGVPFDEYSDFARDVLLSIPPQKAIGTLGDWICEVVRQQTPQTEAQPTDAPAVTLAANSLVGPGFTEEPVRFGQHDHLYGILTHPVGPPQGATVMILSTGYDRMSGWGRITTRICRDLAQAGIPAFRFDFSDVADSPPRAGSPKLVVYSESQIQDVREALTFLESRNFPSVVATGRCSGGYTAFRSAGLDERIRAVIAVNVYDFYIDPREDIAKLISASLQPLSSYGKKMRSGGFLRRAIKGEVDIRRGARNLIWMVAAKIKALLLPVLVMLPFMSDNQKNRIAGFRKLNSRNTRLSLIYSKTDVGLPTLESNFGQNGYALKKLIDLEIDILKNADHNLTTSDARSYWREKIEMVARSISK